MVSDDSVTIVDKNFLAAKYLVGIRRSGHNRHWLIRAKTNTKWTMLEQTAPGDLQIELAVSKQARSQDPSVPRTYRARAIACRFPDSREQQWLLTSLLDTEKYPAEELVALYHERWEIELAYDELETHLLEREEAIRSRTPQGVYQELWGLFLAYNMVRLEMQNIASEADVPPTRISLMMATRYIRDEWFWCAGAALGSIPIKLRKMRARAADFVLPKRRSERRFPRAVKIKMSNYPKKRRNSGTGPPATETADSTLSGN